MHKNPIKVALSLKLPPLSNLKFTGKAPGKPASES